MTCTSTHWEKARVPCATASALLALLIVSVGAQAAAQTSQPGVQMVIGPASQDSQTALACPVSADCVNSIGGKGLPPLPLSGTPPQALKALRATLAQFPEASILTSDRRSMEVVFTTPRGFRDVVEFRLDAQAGRIDFRSRSSFGRNDFGKNRTRMTRFAEAFEQAQQAQTIEGESPTAQ